MSDKPCKIGLSTNPATVAWCTERGHPIVTYSPWLDVSLCRCAEVQVGGEAQFTEASWRAMHEMSHTCEYGTVGCGCYVRKQEESLAARRRR